MKVIEQTCHSIAPVSVVIPCFCCASTITRAVVSIVEQTQQPAEVILVEDGSHDNTLQTLQTLAEQYPDWIKVIALPENQGVSNARNIGWEAATQPYIAFLDADDAWHPKKIEIQYAYMKAHPEVLLSGHSHKIIARNSNLLNWQIPEWSARIIPKKAWLFSNKFVTPSVMLQRNVQQRFAQNQRYMEDYMLWLEFVCSGCIVTKLSAELVATYKSPFGTGGLSSHLCLMEQGELSGYLHIYKKNYINLAQYLGLSLYSVLKFIRRVIIYWGWLRWKV